MKWTIATICSLALILSVVYWVLPTGPEELMNFDDPWGQQRVSVDATQYGAVAGTPWATEVAMEILDDGGNAFDAAIAGIFMLYVTHGEASGFPGIAPVMIYDAVKDTIKGYVGGPQPISYDYCVSFAWHYSRLQVNYT